MLYEMRTYTVKPGSIGDMVKAAATVATEIRKNDYGKLEGYWQTEIGPLAFRALFEPQLRSAEDRPAGHSCRQHQYKTREGDNLPDRRPPSGGGSA